MFAGRPSPFTVLIISLFLMRFQGDLRYRGIREKERESTWMSVLALPEGRVVPNASSQEAGRPLCNTRLLTRDPFAFRVDAHIHSQATGVDHHPEASLPSISVSDPLTLQMHGDDLRIQSPNLVPFARRPRRFNGCSSPVSSLFRRLSSSPTLQNRLGVVSGDELAEPPLLAISCFLLVDEREVVLLERLEELIPHDTVERKS